MNRSSLKRLCSLPCCLLIGTLATSLSADEPLITNGDFATWEGGTPEGWKVEIGAKSGADQPVSTVRQIGGPALLVSGNAATKAWRSVSQKVNVASGQSYRLEFDARSKGVKREGQQYNNCYVGWMSLDGQEQVVGRAIQDLSSEITDWKQFSIDYTVPKAATNTVVTVFLSKSGMLGIKGVAVTPVNRDAALDGDGLLRNGAFTRWSDGTPEGWQVEVGANNGGNSPVSEVAAITNEGLKLTGNARTKAWRSLTQDIDAEPGKSYSLTFQANAKDIAREGRQFNNCYVGVMYFDRSGKKLGVTVEDLSQLKKWTPMKIGINPPSGTAKTSVLIFLSKSGTLMVKEMRVQEGPLRTPFR